MKPSTSQEQRLHKNSLFRYTLSVFRLLRNSLLMHESISTEDGCLLGQQRLIQKNGVVFGPASEALRAVVLISFAIGVLEGKAHLTLQKFSVF